MGYTGYERAERSKAFCASFFTFESFELRQITKYDKCSVDCALFVAKSRRRADNW